MPHVARTLNNLAILHANREILDQAETGFIEALKIYRDLAQSNPQIFMPEMAMTLSNLAHVHMETDNLDQAETEYTEALNIYQNLIQLNPQGSMLNTALDINKSLICLLYTSDAAD